MPELGERQFKIGRHRIETGNGFIKLSLCQSGSDASNCDCAPVEWVLLVVVTFPEARVVPVGLIAAMDQRPVQAVAASADTQAAAAHAREIIMDIERGLGFEPTDREFEKLGYDIESHLPNSGSLRFIEVKGRIAGAEVLTVTRNEILYSLNKPEDFILAMVEFHPDGSYKVYYLRQPFQREPDFGVTSVNYNFTGLLERAEEPS